jgi:hypothetical protein
MEPRFSAKGGGNMYLAMGVDAASDGAGSFYDGHGHPFLLNG